MRSHTLAIDFGTSNSAAALAHAGGVYRIAIEHGAETLPTAVFFPASGGAMRIGRAASEALIGGTEGRYMRALKSVLGAPLLHEARLIGGRRRSLAEIITAFLAELRSRAETATGLRFAHALSGRPVHFHPQPERDAQAEADLRACYLGAGFETVRFLAEPEAAALATCGLGAAEQTGLIVDIGGGTSDFSVFQTLHGRVEILASHGIRLGGTDFDQAVSLAHAMGLLGLGGSLRRALGPGLLPVPRAPYVELSNWAQIPFLYTPEMRRMVAGMQRQVVDPAAMGRFATVLDQELGHALAFAVERGKIAANRDGQGRIDMAMIAAGLGAAISAHSLDSALLPERLALREAAAQTLAMSGVSPAALGRVILVGGSSLMRLVAEEMAALCPQAQILRSEAFTAVVDGLALAASG